MIPLDNTVKKTVLSSCPVIRTKKKEIKMPKIEIKQSEVEHVAIRMNNACERFVAAAMELGKVERPVAEAAMAAFLKEKLIKIDAVGGQMIVKNAQVYDHEVLMVWAEEAKFMGLVK